MLLKAIHYTDLAVIFLLELCMLAAFGYWGARTGGALPLRIALAIGAPAVAAVVWGILLAPRARRPLPRPAHLALKSAIFGLAALALATAGQPTLAIIFLAAVLGSHLLLLAWHEA
jgi:hypothetical protein